MTTPQTITTYKFAFVIDDNMCIVKEYDVTSWSEHTYGESKKYWDGVRNVEDGGTWIYVELEVDDEV